MNNEEDIDIGSFAEVIIIAVFVNIHHKSEQYVQALLSISAHRDSKSYLLVFYLDK